MFIRRRGRERKKQQNSRTFRVKKVEFRFALFYVDDNDRSNDDGNDDLQISMMTNEGDISGDTRTLSGPCAHRGRRTEWKKRR